MTHTTFTPDHCQQEVISACGGFHLVLAPPGCGKTQILTERIRHAHTVEGIAYADMLCLTFTNRAARGMMERIQGNIADEEVADVFVGNVHKYCSRFLFSNALVASESSVIDEDDAVSILARYLGDDEYAVMSNNNLRRNYANILHLESMMHQISHNHPKAIRMHADCINANDIAAMRRICEVTGRTFDAAAMTDIYENADTYRDLTHTDTCDYGDQQVIAKLLQKMTLARQYQLYKRRNHLLDFHDLLVQTYDALVDDSEQTVYKRYPWVQVDEVQDLNPLQMAIIKLLTSRPFHTVMFLGDEQQAIFSFMGAKLDALTALKQQSKCQLHHLSVNHRSPKYLLDIFNTYAAKVLQIDPSLLPEVGKQCTDSLLGNELGILCSETYEQEVRDCVQFAQMLSHNFPESSTALVVNSNRDAEVISDELRRRGVGHFKVSGTDLFSLPEVKLLFAHLGVLNNEFSFMSWARLMKGLRVYENNGAARNFVRQLFDRAIMPSDLLRFDATTYLQNFVGCYEADTIVVFDTETTGLNVFEDDILQIAAVKMRQGKVVDGSELTLYIHTDRPIPAMLGDIVNPIIEERRHHRLLAGGDALRQFMAYAEGCMLLGHNADYDYHILDFNLRRYAPDINLRERHPSYLDSLRLVRLLHPEFKEHKLKYLLSVLGLEGTNSHLADDDVNATRNVVVHCYGLAKERVGEQERFLADSRVRQRVATLQRNYRDMYVEALGRMYERGEANSQVSDSALSDLALTSELSRFYDYLLAEGLVGEIDGLRFILAYLSGDMIDPSKEPSLYEQLCNHFMELTTLKEADLCGSRSIDECIFVTTIHKAKGLEFDNVIVFDAVDGRMPNYYSRNNPRQLAEDARKFYVAISRAKQRLYVAHCLQRIDYHNVAHDVLLTPLMQTIAKYFKQQNFSAAGNLENSMEG